MKIIYNNQTGRILTSIKENQNIDRLMSNFKNASILDIGDEVLPDPRTNGFKKVNLTTLQLEDVVIPEGT